MAWHNFIFIQIKSSMERGNASLQITYAMESIHRHTLSAVSVENASMFTESKSSAFVFCFLDEQDVYNITPNKYNDSIDYYYLGSGDKFMLNATNITSGLTTNKTLFDCRYKPQITFSYVSGNEPNMFMRLLMPRP
ncbi:MAG: hypothetical protein AABZ65_02730 [Candidatus Omnitrophota bacterium]